MNLKKFREYPFTENTEARDMGGWHEVCSYEKTTKPISISGDIHGKNGIRQIIVGNVFWLNYDNILELREKPVETYVNVYENGVIEKLDTMIGNGDTKLLCAFRGVECNSSEYHKPENWRPNSWRMRENEQEKYRIFKGHQSGASHSYSSADFKSPDFIYYILEQLYTSEQEPEIPNSVLKDYLPHEKPTKQENVFSKEQYAEIYKLISDWFHSFIKECELITKEQVK